jgi:ubiquinone/menaquinone biosynthesis C-methylase UbiE
MPRQADQIARGFFSSATVLVLRMAGACRRLAARQLGQLLYGHRPDLGHGSERQVARRLDGIRRDHRTRYSFASRNIGGGRILDIACGSGYGSFMLGRADPARSVIGADRCAQTVAFARRHYSLPNVSFKCAEALEISGADEFDAIVSLETLEHIHEESRFLRVLRRLARSHCTLVVSTPNEHLYPYCPSFNPHHVRHHTPEQLDQLLSATGWEVISRHSQGHDGSEDIKPGTDGRFLIYTAKPF